MTGYMKCPYCGEDDFDEEGLRFHLHRYCEKTDHASVDLDRGVELAQVNREQELATAITNLH